jgi:hypothetical protein
MRCSPTAPLRLGRLCCAWLALAVALPGCSKPVDLKQVLQVTDMSGGYHDAGIVDRRNKIVPSVTFRIRKSTEDSLRPLSVNVVFKQMPVPGTAVAPGSPAETDFDEVFKQSVPFVANQTDLLTVRSQAGYTGDPPQSRADMLKNSRFQDMRVHIFAKHSASQWVEIAQFDLPRQILTQ